jgi:hypothetical protein
LYDHHTGKPQKLRRDSKSDKCEACRQALWKEEPTEATDPKKRQRRSREEAEAELYENSLRVEGLTLLRSSAADELYWLQEDLVVEHFLRRGDFWVAIKGLRKRWNIVPATAIPPEDSRVKGPFPQPEEISEDELKKLLRRWTADLCSVSQRFFPKRPRVMSGANRFVTSCAFYDPPRDNLFDFFQTAAAPPRLQLPEGWETRKDKPLIAGSGLPVKKLSNSGREAGAWRIYYQGIIRELGERHLKPLGLDVEELVEDVLHHNPALSKNLKARLHQANDEASQYIEVNDYTTKDDVVHAHKFITQFRQPLTGGTQGRSRLVAVQYAILQDEYGWTREQIAEQYEGQTDATFLRRLGDYVKAGRKILKNG